MALLWQFVCVCVTFVGDLARTICCMGLLTLVFWRMVYNIVNMCVLRARLINTLKVFICLLNVIFCVFIHFGLLFLTTTANDFGLYMAVRHRCGTNDYITLKLCELISTIKMFLLHDATRNETKRIVRKCVLIYV